MKIKKIVLFFIITIVSVQSSEAQEWFTNLDVAKRLAHIQDKMLLVVWEESFDYAYPLFYVSDNGDAEVVDLSVNKSLDAIIWEHFIPVLINESEYDNLIKDADGRGAQYIAKLNDDSIKIMDANKNILNVKTYIDRDQNLSFLIEVYSLRTTFLRQDLINYSKQENFTTSFNLGSKYIDFALFVEKKAREEIIDLANIYLNEARIHLTKDDLKNKLAYAQRIDLLAIKEDLVLDKARRASRFLKRINKLEVDSINYSLYSFLNYTTFIMLKDEENAALWKNDVSEADIKKTELIFNINN